MSRAEYKHLNLALLSLRNGDPQSAETLLSFILTKARIEFDAEDAHHDRPINIEDSTHGHY